MKGKLTVGCLLLGIGALANAETYLYTSALNGFQEVPPANSQGIAIIALTLDDSDFSVSGEGQVFFLSDDPTLFHIHEGAFGVSGPPILDIGPSAFNAGGDIAFDLTLADQAEFDALKSVLDAELGYFNIHTGNYPDGEIRGQIAAIVPEPASLAIIGLGALGLLRRKRLRA